MILDICSNAGYLNKPKVHSRAGGHFFLSNNSTFPPNNGAILNIMQIIKSVMSLVAEAELGSLYVNLWHYATINQQHRFKQRIPLPKESLTLKYKKMHKRHGHAAPLAMGPQSISTITIVLATRGHQLHRLLENASCSGPSPKHAKQIFHCMEKSD